MQAEVAMKKENIENGMSNHREDLNKEFVELFDRLFDRETMQEFIYGVDLLCEITKSSNFPNGRLLNNKDITPRLILALKKIAEVNGEKAYYGCQVSKETEELITEFFDYKYPSLFYRIFTKIGTPFLVFYLDGVMLQLTFQKQIGSIKDHCCIVFNNTKNGTVCHLPFHVTRCNE